MANWFGVEELLLVPKTPDTPEKQAKKIHDIKLEDVHNSISEIFVPEKRNFTVVGTYGWLGKKRAISLLK